MAKLKLTQEMQDQICASLRVGNFCEQAAVAAGLSESSFWRYMETGSDVAKAQAACEDLGKPFEPTETEQQLLAFWEAVTRARAEAEVTAVAYVRKAMPEDWKAAMAFLERAFPKRWGKRLQTIESELPEEELTRAQSRIVADAVRAAFVSAGMDPDDPEVRKLMREALLTASTADA